MKQKVLAIGDLSQYVEPGVPVGFVGYWMGTVNNIPDGWFICNGATFSSAVYPKLYNALNKKSTLPDFISSYNFIRCSTTANVTQTDTMRRIYGYIDTEAGLQKYTGCFYRGNTGDDGGKWGSDAANNPGAKNDTIFFDSEKYLPDNTGSEVRPKNRSAIPIIKHD